MTTFEKGRLIFTLTLTLLAGIFTGWEGALGVLLFAGFIMGIWRIVCWIVDYGIPQEPQEPRSGPPVIELVEDDPYWHPDPTRPQDDKTHEHPIIDLDNYRRRKELGQ